MALASIYWVQKFKAWTSQLSQPPIYHAGSSPATALMWLDPFVPTAELVFLVALGGIKSALARETCA